MQPKNLTIDDLRNLIAEGEAKDPIVFLEAIMNGQDPRSCSKIAVLANEIDSLNEGAPDATEWYELLNLINSICKYHVVSVSEAAGAARTLAEYLHPKRKQIDIKGAGGAGGDPAKQPLTEEDIILFKERFNDEF